METNHPGPFLRRAFCPAVLVITNQDVEAVCRKNGNDFTMCKLLESFAFTQPITKDIPKVRVNTDANGQPVAVRSLEVKFNSLLNYGAQRPKFQFLMIPPDHPEYFPAVKDAPSVNQFQARYLSSMDSSALGTNQNISSNSSSSSTSPANLSSAQSIPSSDISSSKYLSNPHLSWSQSSNPRMTPWFDEYRTKYLKSLGASSHELLEHPVACIVMTTSNDLNPLDTLTRLFDRRQSTNSFIPKYIDISAMAFFYVVVHDTSTTNIPMTEAVKRFANVEKQFGAACSLITLNSSPTLIKTPEISDSTMTYLTPTDVQGLQRLVRNLVWIVILPHMEKSCQMIYPEVSKERGGLMHKFNLMWGSKFSKKAGDDSDSDGMLFELHSLEFRERRLADWAFMIGDYLIAHKTYMSLADIYKNEASTVPIASVYRASALEMAANCMCMLASNNAYMATQAQWNEVDRLFGESFDLYTKGKKRMWARRCALLHGYWAQYRLQSSSATVAFDRLISDSPDVLENALLTQQLAISQILRSNNLSIVTAASSSPLTTSQTTSLTQSQAPPSLTHSTTATTPNGNASHPSSSLPPTVSPHSTNSSSNNNTNSTFANNTPGSSSLPPTPTTSLTFSAPPNSPLNLSNSNVTSINSYNSFSIGRLRTFALHMLKAGDGFTSALQYLHGISCYLAAHRVYHGKSWTPINDYLHFRIARLGLVVQRPDLAMHFMTELLKSNNQPSHLQNSYMREYLYIFKTFGSQVPPSVTPSLQMMTLPSSQQSAGTFSSNVSASSSKSTPSSSSSASQKEAVFAQLLQQSEMNPLPFSPVPILGRKVKLHVQDIIGGPNPNSNNNNSASNSEWNELELAIIELMTPPDKRYLLTLRKPTKTENIGVVGENIFVDVEMTNNLSIPVQFTDMRLSCHVAPSYSAAAAGATTATSPNVGNLSTTSSVTSSGDHHPFYHAEKFDKLFAPNESRSLQLAVKPLIEGNLTILGVRFKLSGVLEAARPLVKSVALKVASPMPRIELAMLGLPQEGVPVYVGQLYSCTLRVTNVGQRPLHQLALTCSHPHVIYSTSFKEDLSLPHKWCVKIPMPNPLQPNHHFEIPMVIRPTTEGQQSYKFLVYYEPFSQSGHSSPDIKHRLQRATVSLKVVKSLKIGARVLPDPVHVGQYLLSVDVENLTKLKTKTSATIALRNLRITSPLWRPLLLDSATGSVHKDVTTIIPSASEISQLQQKQQQQPSSKLFPDVSGKLSLATAALTDAAVSDLEHIPLISANSSSRPETPDFPNIMTPSDDDDSTTTTPRSSTADNSRSGTATFPNSENGKASGTYGNNSNSSGFKRSLHSTMASSYDDTLITNPMEVESSLGLSASSSVATVLPPRHSTTIIFQLVSKKEGDNDYNVPNNMFYLSSSKSSTSHHHQGKHNVNGPNSTDSIPFVPYLAQESIIHKRTSAPKRSAVFDSRTPEELEEIRRINSINELHNLSLYISWEIANDTFQQQSSSGSSNPSSTGTSTQQVGSFANALSTSSNSSNVVISVSPTSKSAKGIITNMWAASLNLIDIPFLPTQPWTAVSTQNTLNGNNNSGDDDDNDSNTRVGASVSLPPPSTATFSAAINSSNPSIPPSPSSSNPSSLANSSSSVLQSSPTNPQTTVGISPSSLGALSSYLLASGHLPVSISMDMPLHLGIPIRVWVKHPRHIKCSLADEGLAFVPVQFNVHNFSPFSSINVFFEALKPYDAHLSRSMLNLLHAAAANGSSSKKLADFHNRVSKNPENGKGEFMWTGITSLEKHSLPPLSTWTFEVNAMFPNPGVHNLSRWTIVASPAQYPSRKTVLVSDLQNFIEIENIGSTAAPSIQDMKQFVAVPSVSAASLISQPSTVPDINVTASPSSDVMTARTDDSVESSSDLQLKQLSNHTLSINTPSNTDSMMVNDIMANSPQEDAILERSPSTPGVELVTPSPSIQLLSSDSAAEESPIIEESSTDLDPSNRMSDVEEEVDELIQNGDSNPASGSVPPETITGSTMDVSLDGPFHPMSISSITPTIEEHGDFIASKHPLGESVTGDEQYIAPLPIKPDVTVVQRPLDASVLDEDEYAPSRSGTTAVTGMQQQDPVTPLKDGED